MSSPAVQDSPAEGPDLIKGTHFCHPYLTFAHSENEKLTRPEMNVAEDYGNGERPFMRVLLRWPHCEVWLLSSTQFLSRQREAMGPCLLSQAALLAAVGLEATGVRRLGGLGKDRVWCAPPEAEAVPLDSPLLLQAVPHVSVFLSALCWGQ